ncbi:MAG: GNAT family N-acetyltransferase [Chloroflexota bacterium]
MTRNFWGEFWGLGIASESLRQFLGREMRRPLFAHVAKYNVASQKVLKKCGFEFIGWGTWVAQCGRR